MSSTYFTCDALAEIRESSVHPVLPKDTDAIAERRKVGLDHAESSVDGPEDEKDDEEVVRVPEALEVCTSRFLCRRECDRHECHQHNISTPARASRKVGQNEAHESEVVARRESRKIVPVGNGVDPGEKDDRPRD